MMHRPRTTTLTPTAMTVTATDQLAQRSGLGPAELQDLLRRMLAAFRSWKALEQERRRVAKKTLQRIAKTKPLSHDVFEIVSKMLE